MRGKTTRRSASLRPAPRTVEPRYAFWHSPSEHQALPARLTAPGPQSDAAVEDSETSIGPPAKKHAKTLPTALRNCSTATRR